MLTILSGVRFSFLSPRFAYLILLAPKKRSENPSVVSSVTDRQVKIFDKQKGNIEQTPKMTPPDEANIPGQAPPPLSQVASTATPAMSTSHISESVDEPSYVGTGDDSAIDEDPYKQGFFKFFTHKKPNKYPKTMIRR